MATDKIFEDSCKETSNTFREDLKALEERARSFVDAVKSTGNGEAIAQATIAMRHIEDARMRYGKVIQYIGDGVSCFDKPRLEDDKIPTDK